MSLRAFAVEPTVNKAVELAIARPDHALEQLDFRMPIPDLMPFQGIVSSKSRLDRAKLADPTVQDALS
eukprot:6406815-Pyramimonas_sp.AAC.1